MFPLIFVPNALAKISMRMLNNADSGGGVLEGVNGRKGGTYVIPSTKKNY